VEAPSPPPPPAQRAPETIGRAFREARRSGITVRQAAAIVGADEDIPLDVLKVSLTSAETDGRRRRRKNQESLEAAIELSKKEAEKKKAAASNASRHAQEQARAVRILAGKVDENDEDEENPYYVFSKRFKDDGAGGSGKGKSPM